MRTLVLLLSVLTSQAQPPRPAPFITPLAPADMKNKQAVVEAIEATPVDGEKPTTRFEVIRARVTRAER